MDERNNNSQKYDAFISYTHKDLDVFVAETIHKKLERYHIPKKLRNKSGERRFSRIFRDKEELAVSPDLSENICRALENSEYLIVLCSPEAKESVWVQREIEYFLEWHDHDHILPVLLKGEPSEAFPQILCEKQISKTDESGKETVTTVALEPLSADVRGANRKVVFRKCGTELLRLVAVMLGCSYDELKQRHREYVMKKVVAALSLALILSLGFAAFALNQRNQINLQYQISRINQARYLAEKANQQLDEGDRIGALSTALEVTPNDRDAAEAVVPEQMYVLNRALYAYQHSQQYIYRPVIMNKVEGINTESSGFNQDGGIFFCLDDLGNVYFYDTETCRLLWKTTARSVNDEEKDNFLWGYFFDSDRVVLASPDMFYILNADKQICEGMISSDNENYIDQPSAIHKNTLAVFHKEEGGICLYDLEQGKVLDRLTCEDLENSVMEMKNSVSIVTFSDDGKRLAVGMEHIPTEQTAGQYDNLFVFDCTTRKMTDSFYENSIVELLFISQDDLALISYDIPENNLENIPENAYLSYIGASFDYEYENKILDISAKRTLWQSEKYRHVSDFFEETDMGINNIGMFNVYEESLPLVVFYYKSSFEAVNTNTWTTFQRQTFDSDIKNIIKINANNLLLGMSSGTVYCSSLINYSSALAVDGEVQNIYYDTNSDTIVQIRPHDIIFLRKPKDENMTYYGPRLPDNVVEQLDRIDERSSSVTITGKKYKAVFGDRKVIVKSVDEKKVLLEVPVSNEVVLFDFITDEEYLLIYDSRINRLSIWNVEKAETLTDQTFELESRYKSQLIIDEKNNRFALNLKDTIAVMSENGLQYRYLDIFTWDNNFQIYHFASIPYGDVDFENDKIYCSTTLDGEPACYVAPVYDYNDLRERAEAVINEAAN